MLGQWTSELQTFIPWIALITGFGGSLHCIGMCGGLVTASCHSNTQIMSYQIGRLFSYLILGVIGGTLGSILNFRSSHPLVNLLPAIFIGLMFIFWGVQSLRGKSTLHSAPKLLSKSYQSLWRKLVANNNNNTKPLLIGSLSILLPCGFLYSIVLGTMATQSTMSAVVGMFFFWLGTLPSMLLAPGIVQKFLRPFQAKRPKIYAICLVLIGVSTIGFRATAQMNKVHKKGEHSQHSCH